MAELDHSAEGRRNGPSLTKQKARCREVLILIGEWPKGTEIDEGEGGLMKGAEVGDNEGQCVCPFSWKEESEE